MSAKRKPFASADRLAQYSMMEVRFLIHLSIKDIFQKRY
ncbi:hypothetical protein BN136_3415 [Cronobacter universalis NCTC 9529]|nr:hypothetical protein BN136_3415 [Cronobacter universalis NCTC 9529]